MSTTYINPEILANLLHHIVITSKISYCLLHMDVYKNIMFIKPATPLIWLYNTLTYFSQDKITGRSPLMTAPAFPEWRNFKVNSSVIDIVLLVLWIAHQHLWWATWETLIHINVTLTSSGTTIASHIEGMLPKGPYPPCLRMADRALLAGYPRYASRRRNLPATRPRLFLPRLSLTKTSELRITDPIGCTSQRANDTENVSTPLRHN